MPITLKRLQEVPVKGNFSINCETNAEFDHLTLLFNTSNDYIYFKDVQLIGTKSWSCNLVRDETRKKFTIKYESLAELLKLRDIFKIRGAKFDTYLLEKRKMGTFDSFFSVSLLEEFKNLNISKIRK